MRPDENDPGSTPASESRLPRKLLLLRAGMRLLGLFADDTDGEIRWRTLAPLPRAPESVLGIVSSRGRMLTVLDPLPWFGDARQDSSPPNFIVALPGDEQLALAVDRVEDIIEIFPEEILPSEEGSPSALHGIVIRGADHISVLDPREMFATATVGEDRRRKRF
jgi:chemotaxis signal transduction protein